MSLFNKFPKRQSGLSLIELMVALALGLVLMVGVLQVFLTTRQTYANSEAMTRLQDNGRFALEMIANSARHAAYTDPRALSESGLSTPQLAGLDCENQNGIKVPGGVVCSSDGGGNLSDSVGFALQPPLTDGVRRDCLGNSDLNNDGVVDDNDNSIVIINHFAIIPPDTITDPSNPRPAALGCHAWSVTAGTWVGGVSGLQPLVEGIDSLQVLYGVDENGGATRSPTRYVSADNVGNWSDVLAVRIAVLANSVSTLTPSPPNRNYVLLDAAPLAANDLGNDNRARQIFSTSINLKNAK